MDSIILGNCFYLGILVAEHVYGIGRKSEDGKFQDMVETLKAVARGDLTLVDTAEEVAAERSPFPEELVKKLHQHLRKSRERQQVLAKQLIQGL